MACTTIKLPTKNRVTCDRWTAYCQAIHVHRLLHARPGIDIPSKKSAEKEAKTRIANKSKKKIQQDMEKQAEIQRQNQLLLKKILALEHRKPNIGMGTGKHGKRKGKGKGKRREEVSKGDIMRANRAVVKAMQAKLENQKISEENDRMVKRIITAKATINTKKMNREEKKRSKLLRNLALNSKNRVLDLGHLTLDAIVSGKSPEMENLLNPTRPNLTRIKCGEPATSRNKTNRQKGSRPRKRNSPRQRRKLKLKDLDSIEQYDSESSSSASIPHFLKTENSTKAYETRSQGKASKAKAKASKEPENKTTSKSLDYKNSPPLPKKHILNNKNLDRDGPRVSSSRDIRKHKIIENRCASAQTFVQTTTDKTPDSPAGGKDNNKEKSLPPSNVSVRRVMNERGLSNNSSERIIPSVSNLKQEGFEIRRMNSTDVTLN